MPFRKFQFSLPFHIQLQLSESSNYNYPKAVCYYEFQFQPIFTSNYNYPKAPTTTIRKLCVIINFNFSHFSRPTTTIRKLQLELFESSNYNYLKAVCYYSIIGGWTGPGQFLGSPGMKLGVKPHQM